MTRIRKFDRRKFFSTTAAVSVLGLTIPMWASQAFAAKRGGTLRISVNTSPSKLNPLLQRLSSEYLLGELLYSGLVRLGPNMEPVPDLAESWTSSADLTVWTFKLRAGAKFHNGKMRFD